MADDQERARLQSLIAGQPPAEGHGVVEWLNRLCRTASQEVDLAAVAITVGAPGNASAVIAATEPAGRRFAEADFGVGEGPAYDAWTRRRPVLIPELGGPQDGTWPGYTAAASTLGIRAVFVFPLQVGAARVGMLSLFHDHPGRLSHSDLNSCLIMAELATQRLLDNSIAGGEVDGDLDAALGFRSEIYQAQGMVAVALGISLIDGLARMRGHAFHSGRDLIDIANDIVHNGLRLGTDDYDRNDDDDSDDEE